jgi:23S rRNA (adenine2503-C2)-methyltransferase
MFDPSKGETLENIYGLDRAALAEKLELFDARPFHSKQLYRWLYLRGEWNPQDWTDFPKELRETFGDYYRIDPGHLSDQTGASDDTIKYRVELAGGGVVEAVYMRQSERVTMCISSQVGCALDCDFCLTGKMGFTRHLSAGEIVGQVALIKKDRELDESFNIVFMGMGEPLHNYDGVMSAIKILCDSDGFAMSRKRITVSTSGLAPAIERLAEEEVRPRLAVSLNATTDEVRRRIMPITKKYPIQRLLDACQTFRERTGEEFTLESVLLAGINDTDADVRRLISFGRRLHAKINLIPFNPVPGWLNYQPPAKYRIEAIHDQILQAGGRVYVRWSRGKEARAACGQLALLPDKPEQPS